MKIRNKLRLKRFFKEQLWQLLIVIAFLLILAFIFNKYIESIMFCVAHTIIRNKFKKQYHSNSTALCLCLTLGIAWVCISYTLPIGISIISTIPICFLVAYIGFVAQDRLDKIIENTKLKSQLDGIISKLNEYENINLYAMEEPQLRQFGASKGLSIIQQDILVHRIIDNLKISEICSYRNYSRTTIKYHIGEIKQKLNIDNI